MNPAWYEAPLAQLRAGSESERRAAIDALETAGDPDSVWPLALIAIAPEEGEHARVAAAAVLCHLAPRSSARLVEHLDTSDPQERAAAHLALALLVGSASFGAERQALVMRWFYPTGTGQPDPAALHALETFIEALVRLPDFAKLRDQRNQNPFARYDDDEMVVVGMPDGRFGLHWDERLCIVLGIGRVVAIAPSLMRAVARDPSEQARWLVYSVIKEKGAYWPIAELAQAVRYDIMGNAALKYLLAAGATRAPAIACALSDPSLVGDLASAPVEWAGWSREMAPLFDALVERLRQDEAAIRRNALVLLCALEDGRIIPLLLSALTDPDATVREQAAIGIGRYARHLPASPHVADAVPLLLVTLADPQPSVRAQAARALGLVRDARAVDPLIAALTDPVEAVRTAAVAALGAFPDDRVAEALARALVDPAVGVGRQAVTSLGRIKASVPLIAAIGHPAAEVRAAAIKQLLYVDRNDRALEPLIAALRDPVEEVRAAATDALGWERYRDERALEPLLVALRDPAQAVRYAAAGALGWERYWDARALEPLLATLCDPVESNLTRWRATQALIGAIRVLGELGATEVVLVLVEALADPVAEVRSAAADALRELGDRRVVPALCRALYDPNDYVAKRAKCALRQFHRHRVVWPLLWGVFRERDPGMRVRRCAAAICLLLGW